MPGSGLQGLATYLKGQSLWRNGISASDNDIANALNKAAASGAISPAQYETLQGHIQADTPLHHVGGAATPALEAIIANLGIPSPSSAPSPITQASARVQAGRTGVRDTVKYGEAVQVRQATYEAAAAQLNSEGLKAAAQAVKDAQHKSNPSDRVTIFERLPPVQQMRVKALIGAELFGRD